MAAMLEKALSLLRPSRGAATLIQVAIFPALLYLYFSVERVSAIEVFVWFVFHFLYATVGQVVGHHRYFTHRQFETRRMWEGVLLFFTIVNGLGSPQSYAYIHFVHHKYADGDRDPHGPSRGLASILFAFHGDARGETWALRSRHMLDLHRRWWWVHQYYIALMLCFPALLALIDFRIFIFAWVLPASSCAWGLGVSVYLQHFGGRPNNSRISGVFGFGERLHAIHHANPRQFNLAEGTGSFDLGYLVARLIAK